MCASVFPRFYPLICNRPLSGCSGVFAFNLTSNVPP